MNRIYTREETLEEIGEYFMDLLDRRGVIVIEYMEQPYFETWTKEGEDGYSVFVS